MAQVELSHIDILALKKLALICGALGQTLSGTAGIEQRNLTRVLIEVINRADLAAHIADAQS